MAPNPFFSGRIPKDLHSRIEKHLEETGQSKTQLLVNALSSYLDYPVEPNISSGNLAEDRLFSLEKRVEILERSLSAVQSNQFNRFDEQVGIDNRLDNEPDNEESRSQSPLADSDNTLDNEPDNITLSEAQVLKRTDESFSEDNYEYLGEYHISEILGFDFELEEHQLPDKNKIKNKLRNANITKHKTVLIKPYFFKIVGKEEGKKGQLIYGTYRLKAK